MRITYDKKADAIYVYLMQIPVLKSFGIVNKTEGDYPIHFDYTKESKLFGIEILEASSFFSTKTLNVICCKKRETATEMIKDLKSFNGDDIDNKSVLKVIETLEKQ